VLKIPNAALRFIPPADLLGDAAPGDKEKEKDKDRDKDKDKPRGPGGGGGRGRIWVQDPTAGLKAIPVMTVPGATDGSFTLLKSGEIQEGQEVITGLVQSGPDAGMSNPFVTQRPGGGRR
jgi:hypothetical protein